MYKIIVNPEKNLIELELEGFWAESHFEQFMADEQAALQRLRCPIGKHRLLCDLSNLKVIAQNVAARIAQDLNSQGPRDAEWIAIVVSAPLLKLQMQRLLTRSNAQIFDDFASAREWLLAA
jgi:hypothetical protein